MLKTSWGKQGRKSAWISVDVKIKRSTHQWFVLKFLLPFGRAGKSLETIGISVFFSGYIPHNPLKKVTVERFLKFQVLLTSPEAVSEEKFQWKNENFGALRALNTTAEEEKTRGKVFWLSYRRTKGPTGVIFLPKGCFYVNFQKSSLICTPKCDSWEIKKWSRR